MRQGTLCFKEYKNYIEELYNYSDIHISCKYGFKNGWRTPVQVGTITDASLQTSATYDFITISGDSQNMVANWDETQYTGDPVLYDVVITVNNMKINTFSPNDPTEWGWHSSTECQTIDGAEGNPLYFLADTTNVFYIETVADTLAWSTTEPYFGTGVIADGAYYNETENTYIVIDGTNHPGQLSFSSTTSWESSNERNYSKQTSGSMFYMWRSTDITECTALNHYTWDTSNVKLCYDNTTDLTVNGITYTKQNPGPAYYEIKCGFNYGGSVRPAKTFIRWGTNEPYTQITYGGVNPEYFSWQEQSVPSGEIGTLVVEFVDSNNNGLIVGSYSSQDYVFDTDTSGSYGGTRLLIKSPDDSNIYDYAAGNFIECNITLSAAPQPTTYTVTVITDPDVMTATGGGTYNSGASCTLTATVIDPMYEFEDWNDGSSVLSTSNPYTFTVTSNITVYGRHREVQPPQPSSAILTVTTNDCTLGEVCIGSGNYRCSDSRTVYDYENPVEIYAQAVDPDAFFDGWYVDGTYESHDNPYEVAVYEDRTYQAHFTQVAPPPTEYYTIYGSISGQGTISGTGTYMEGDNITLTATPASGWEFERWWDADNYEDYYDNPLTIEGLNRDWNIVAVFAEIPEPPQPTTYTITVNVTGQGTTTGAGGYEEGDQVTLTAAPSTGYEFSSWQINGTVVETNSTYQFIMGNQDVTITAVFTQEAEKHIYLCDNSGAHLAEMTNTDSTWSVSGAFTSGQYSIRATVEGEYDDAWFKFYQTSGDNRVFVGAGDDPSFEDIGTYIVIDDILTSFSLTEDQETGYYVVSYENTGAMTVSMVDTIVNSYIGGLNIPTDTSDLTNGAGFITVSDVSSMSYITMTDIEACGYTTVADISAMSYITMTDISNIGYLTQSDISNMSYITMNDVQGLGYVSGSELVSMSYVDSTSLSNMGYLNQSDISSMSYVDQTSLSSMAYVDNSYLSTYMNNVVGNIESILQTI